jgi:hypothetical protein
MEMGFMRREQEGATKDKMGKGGLSEEALQRLERLAALRDRQALSATEYQEQKDRILADASLTAAAKQPDDHSSMRPSSAAAFVSPVEPPKGTGKSKFWIGSLAVVAIGTGASLQLLPSDEEAQSLPSVSMKPTAKRAAPAVLPSPKPADPPTPVDTAAEMRASGWDETVPDGDGCMMDRREDQRDDLNFVFIYRGEGKPTYELSFTSTTSRGGDTSTLNAENAPELKLAVLIDGHRIPAVLQNHYADTWEVEVPLSSGTRSRIARARSINLQLNGEVIAREPIRPNATSIATVERCLTL